MDYPYFIAGFQATDAEYLRQMIISAPSLLATFTGASTSSDNVGGIDGYSITITFSDVLSNQNQTLLNGMMAGYMTSVFVAKSKKLALLQTSAQNYIDARYSFLTRTQLMNLYTLAKFDNLVNRAAYIRPGIDWINTILSYAATTATAINALTNLSDVQSYVIDIAGNAGTDPLITVGAAILISN